MSIENAKKILAYAVAHPSFRASLRTDPRGSLTSFATELALSSDGVSVEELDAVVGLSDADLTSIEKVAVSFGDDFSSEGHTGGVIL